MAKITQCHRCCFWNSCKDSIYCTDSHKSWVVYILYISSCPGKDNAQCGIHGFRHKYFDRFCQYIPLVKELCWIKKEESMFRWCPLFRVGSSPVLSSNPCWRIPLTKTRARLINYIWFTLKSCPIPLSLDISHWILALDSKAVTDDEDSFLFCFAVIEDKRQQKLPGLDARQQLLISKFHCTSLKDPFKVP